MTQFGLFLSSEEHGPATLVSQARRADRAGFESVLISDHFHPWLDRQGESPFVWSVIGAIAATTGLKVTTGVTCPTVRIHPTIIAQAAATSQLLLEGRFVLGVGSGEALKEHILGDHWPPAATRLEMLEEAVDVIRQCGAARSSPITVSTTPLRTPVSTPCRLRLRQLSCRPSDRRHYSWPPASAMGS